MRASYQFLGAVGLLFVSALVFSAMYHKAGFGTAADWAAAGANVAVVIVSLYLASAETRARRAEREQETAEARKDLRASVSSFLRLARQTETWTAQDWPTEVERVEIKFQIATADIEWNLVKTSILPIEDRALGVVMAPRVVALRGLLEQMAGMQQPDERWIEHVRAELLVLLESIESTFARLPLRV